MRKKESKFHKFIKMKKILEKVLKNGKRQVEQVAKLIIINHRL